MKEYIAEVFSEEKYVLGESPFYDPRTKNISWVDIKRGTFFTQSFSDKENSVKNKYSLEQAI